MFDYEHFLKQDYTDMHTRNTPTPRRPIMHDYEHMAMHRERVRDHARSIRRGSIVRSSFRTARRLITYVTSVARRIAEHLKVEHNGCVDRAVPCK